MNHPSRSIPEGTAISHAAACFTSLIAAMAHAAREMYSVSRVSFVAELGRPLMCLMLNKSHNIVKRLPSKCFVMISTGLIVPRIFPILILLFFLFLLQPEVLRLHVFDGAAPTGSICPDSYVSFVSQLVLCWPTRWPHSHSVPCCTILTRRCSVTQPSPSDVDRRVLGQLAASASECPSIVTVLSSFFFG